MSLCRFSSDNFQCDVYVYPSSNGWAVQVARHRLESETPVPELQATWHELPVAQVVQRLREQHTWVRRAQKLPITHRLAGKTLTFDGPAACADALEHLSADGLRVPPAVVAELRGLAQVP